MTDEKSHTEAAGAHDASQATGIRKNETCALSGPEKRSGGNLNPVETTRATAGQFGHPADGGLIERAAALSAICSHAHYDDDWGDLVCAIRAIPAVQPAPDEDKIGALIRVREIALQAETAPLSMIEIVKRVDMALHEETEIPGWMLESAAQDVAHPDDLPDDLCVLSYVSATPAAQPLLPGAQVGSEPGIPAAQLAPEPVAWAALYASGKVASASTVKTYYRTVPLYLHPAPAAQDGAEVERLRAQLSEMSQRYTSACVIIDKLATERDALKAEAERLRAEREDADQSLVDRYRDPKSGRFDFPGDVAKIVRSLDEATVASERKDAEIARLREALSALRAEQKGDA